MKTQNTWFTADLHFGHANVLKFQEEFGTRAIARDIEHHDRLIIENWQRLVEPEDTVYIIGDMFFCNATRALGILEQLPGKIHLVYGNHDKVIRVNPALQGYFRTIQEYLEINLDGQHICMMHYPIYEWNRMHRGALHLYGHTHGKVNVEGRAMDVGIDTRNDLCLWNWLDIREILTKKTIRPHHNKFV